jgi:8-oxo-dGTP diphosphatase
MTARDLQVEETGVPIEGASIAVIKDGSVLLVRRGRPPFAGIWSLPGGKIEAGETPRQAVSRELREETGIEAEIEGVLDKIDVEAGVAQGYRLTVFYGRYRAGSLAPGGDAEAARWVALREIEEMPMTEGTAVLVLLAAHRLKRA